MDVAWDGSSGVVSLASYETKSAIDLDEVSDELSTLSWDPFSN